ncbi:MAG TPA: 16S rRNA (cytidine(1402)-2'-O)-methyltransferase [Treponemataceae bacterium]|nr:16S rRNA (cytidine(1402)-2'-O)-methyltransferase [Treponemataceae bacterium]
MAVLYIVATPIGNLGDITARALETFKAVDVIACEDTRHTLQLLTHFGIRKPLVSCRARNEEAAAGRVLEALKRGEDVAYASDAGTPALSDPGSVLVRMARDAGHRVVPIPGPSAFAALLSVSGGVDKTVVFGGFLSPKPGRRRSRLAELAGLGYGFVLYESPFRVVKLLADLAEIDGERQVVVGRELTKLHEEVFFGTARDAWADFSSRERVLGEFALYVSGKKGSTSPDD